jgi:hypothetical protein
MALFHGALDFSGKLSEAVRRIAAAAFFVFALRSSLFFCTKVPLAQPFNRRDILLNVWNQIVDNMRN